MILQLIRDGNIRWSILGFVFVFFFASTTPANAHPDFSIADGTVEVSPGDFVEFPLLVHFHRVVGSFEVVSPVDRQIRVFLMDEQAFATFATGEPAPQIYSSESGSRGTLNFLIACCIIAGQDDWTKYHLVIDNSDPVAKSVRLKVNLVHDGMAVLTYNAEEFANVEAGGFAIIVGGVLGWYVLKSVRKKVVLPEAAPAGRTIRRVSVASFTVFAGLSTLTLVAALIGSSSYGGTIVYGFAAFQARLGDQTILAAVMFLPWLLSLLLWIKGFSMAVASGSGLAGGVGVVEGIAPLLAGLLVALNYASAPFALLAILLPGFTSTPQVMSGLYLIRKIQKRA